MEITFSFAVLVAAVMALVQLIKGIGLEAKFAPLVAIVLGIGLSMLAVAGGLLDANYIAAGFQGLIAGLSAVGLYSGTSNTADGIKETVLGMRARRE